MAGARRPSPVVTDASRRTVEAMVSYGIKVADIAVALDMTENTLRKYYRNELGKGAIKANAMVAESLFKQAVGAPAEFDAAGNCIRAEQPRVPSAGMFWAKTRMGWREVHKVQVGGDPDDKSPVIINISKTDADL